MLRIIASTLVALTTAAYSQPMSDAVDAVKGTKGQVVQIQTAAGLGSGFWLCDKGLVVTCFHVASGNIGDEVLIKSSWTLFSTYSATL